MNLNTEPNYVHMAAALKNLLPEMPFSLWAKSLILDINQKIEEGKGNELTLQEVTELERLYYHFNQ